MDETTGDGSTDAQDLLSKLQTHGSSDWLQYQNVQSTGSMGGFDFDAAIEAAIEGEQVEGEELNAAEQPEGVYDETEHADAAADLENYEPVAAQTGSPREALTCVPPTGVIAEVVLVMTSFGGVRRNYFSSKRAKHLLDCKGVVYYVIDCNKEFSAASGLKDKELFDQWSAAGRLKKAEREVTIEDNVQIPQIIIDGHPIGDEVSLQDLEEDGDLDWICARAACPSCLNEKDPNDTSCPSCRLPLESIVPEDLVYSRQVQQLYKGQNYGAFSNGGEVFEHPTFKTEESMAEGVAGDFTYEDLFGEAPPPE